MKLTCHSSARGNCRGFSLVELLLTLVLILCLAAASVFTFTAIYRSANLDEGYDRFQSLIRFAQAEAATTGRKIRLQFVPPNSGSAASDSSQTVSDNSSSGSGDERGELRSIQVTWEADLLNAPGVFQSYTNKGWSEEMVNELVGVEKVQTASTPASQTLASGDPTAMPEAAPEPAAAEAQTEQQEFPSITFYPDGSCDSAEIILASRNTEDERRMAVHLSGILGSVSARTVTPSDDGMSEEDFFDDADFAPDSNSDSLSANPVLAQHDSAE